MNRTQISIIIPTYNESENIQQILHSISKNLPRDSQTEAIVVDDESHDGTSRIVENYIKSMKKIVGYSVSLIVRKGEKGLSSAILQGIEKAVGDIIIVMDSDFSHPPYLVPKMVETLQQTKCDVVVASRYIKGGATREWSLKRKLISKVATRIAKTGLGVKTKDPMSGFFAFRRQILERIKFDAIGYKMLLEMLVKVRGLTIKEIPYTFIDRRYGLSKLGVSTILDYCRAVWKLYRYGKSQRNEERRASVRFISKAGRFFTVGTSGLAINILISMAFAGEFANFWYLHANIVGIIISMTTNFFLNKVWTFEDKNFEIKRTVPQYLKFVIFSSLGAGVQLGMVYYLVEGHSFWYPVALIAAVLIAAMSNFVLNKRWTFKEKIWS